MKFTDLISEDESSKDYKKIQLVYKVLKKGKIRNNNYGDVGFAEYKYELSDDKVAKVSKGTLYVHPNSVTIYNNNEFANGIGDLLPVFRAIKKRFQNYNIVFTQPFDYNNIKVVKYNPETINEEFTPDNESSKDHKKAELVYNFLKKGKIRNSYDEKGDTEYTYELSDDKFIKMSGDRLVVSPESITIYKNNELANQVDDLLVIFRSIRKRFANYKIIFNTMDGTPINVMDYTPDTINENFTPDDEQLKEMKRARIVYKTFRKGAVKFMHHSKRNDNDEKTVVKYTLGEPQYNWYPKNGNPNDMYLSVVVKDMTVYIKDPVLYDAIVVNPDRMQDYYGPLIHNYIKPKAERKFEQHGVKLHISEPKVEFVLVEPEEPEAINEDTLNDKDSKTVNIVYNTLKRGKVKVNMPEGDDAIFAYKLSDEYSVDSKYGDLFVSPAGIKIKEMNRAAANSNFTKVFQSLGKRFSNYRINFVKPPMTWDDLINYSFEDASSGEAINEGETELSDKNIKKCKILWKTFHKGKIKYNGKIYMYQLKDDYNIVKIPLTNKPNINIKGNVYDIIRIWEMQDNGHGIYMDYDLYNTIHWKIKEVLNKKFESFNVGTNL